MRLWSVQPKRMFEKLQSEKVLHCMPRESAFVTECGFGAAYDWLAEQMSLRIGPPPDGVQFPIWAWHTVESKHSQPDLRLAVFRGCNEDQACIELEVPDKDVLLSNEDTWHIVLCNSYFGDCANQQQHDTKEKWFNSLPLDEQTSIKRKSWEKIFFVAPPHQSSGKYIQATFWELRLDQVIGVRFYKGRITKYPEHTGTSHIAKSRKQITANIKQLNNSTRKG